MSKSASNLLPGETGIVETIKNSTLTLKLLEMGFLPGKNMKMMRKAPGGSPLYFDLEGNYLALSIEEAESILLSEAPS